MSKVSKHRINGSHIEKMAETFNNQKESWCCCLVRSKPKITSLGSILGNWKKIFSKYFFFSRSYRVSWYYQSFYTNWCTSFLKGVLKFTVKQLRHVSV